MARMVQIRHVPDDVHRKLKARAALAGMSLSEYLLAEVRRTLER
jgi:plasmid stability protein